METFPTMSSIVVRWTLEGLASVEQPSMDPAVSYAFDAKDAALNYGSVTLYPASMVWLILTTLV